MTNSPSELAAVRELYTRMSHAQLAALREDYEIDLASALTMRKGLKLEGATDAKLQPLDESIGGFRWRLGVIDDLQLNRKVRSAEMLESQFASMLQSIESEGLEVHRDPSANPASVWYVGPRDASLRGYGATLRLAFDTWAKEHVQAAAKEKPADG